MASEGNPAISTQSWKARVPHRGADAVKPSRRGSPETTQLRKTNHIQWLPLPACSQLSEHGLDDRRLRRHEALQIEAIDYGHLSSPFSGIASAG
jgi:hypothetical protein